MATQTKAKENAKAPETDTPASVKEMEALIPEPKTFEVSGNTYEYVEVKVRTAFKILSIVAWLMKKGSAGVEPGEELGIRELVVNVVSEGADEVFDKLVDFLVLTTSATAEQIEDFPSTEFIRILIEAMTANADFLAQGLNPAGDAGST